MENNLHESEQYLPTNESAKNAVRDARRIILKNDEMMNRLKAESDIPNTFEEEFSEACKFTHLNTGALQFIKIKSTNGISDFFKDIFGTFS